MMTPKEYSREEVREILLKKIKECIWYWEKRDTSTKNKLSGLAFSILTVLDGDTLELPKFIVAPDPQPEDKDYCIRRYKNWFPENENDINCDLGGSLHEFFHETTIKIHGIEY